MAIIRMNYLRAVKVALRNIAKLNPQYLLLLRNAERPKPEKVIVNDHVFVIASCINIADRRSSFVHNAAHSASQRFEEVTVGLRAVRKYYPDAHIALIESSHVEPAMRDQLLTLSDSFYDYSNDRQIDRARKHYNKGVPQFVAYLKFLRENQNNYQAVFFHFLSARYILTGAVAASKRDPGSYLLFFPEANNVSTRYFFTYGKRIAEIISAFRATLFFAILGLSVEDVIHQYMPDVHFVEKLNVAGNINGQQFIEE